MVNAHNIDRRFFDVDNYYFCMGDAHYDTQPYEFAVDSRGNIVENTTGLSGEPLLYYFAGWLSAHQER